MNAILWTMLKNFLTSKKAVAFLGWTLAKALTPLLGRVGVDPATVTELLNSIQSTLPALLGYLAAQGSVDIVDALKRPRMNDKGELVDKNGVVILPPPPPLP